MHCSALSANASNQTLREWVLPRTLWSGEHFFSAHSLNSIPEVAAIDSVSVTDQEAWRRVFRERFDNLLGCPFGCGMFGHVEMDHSPSLMRQHHENKQHAHMK